MIGNYFVCRGLVRWCYYCLILLLVDCIGIVYVWWFVYINEEGGGEKKRS